MIAAWHRYVDRVGLGDRRRFPKPHWPAPIRVLAVAFWAHPLYAVSIIVLAVMQALGFALLGWSWWHR